MQNVQDLEFSWQFNSLDSNMFVWSGPLNCAEPGEMPLARCIAKVSRIQSHVKHGHDGESNFRYKENFLRNKDKQTSDMCHSVDIADKMQRQVTAVQKKQILTAACSIYWR